MGHESGQGREKKKAGKVGRKRYRRIMVNAWDILRVLIKSD